MLAVDYLMVDERVKTEKDLMDYIRTIIFGYENGETLHSYWEKHNKDYFTMDIRLGARIRERWELQFMVNNLLNTEYSYRPMALAAPRSYVCRLNYTF
jgi:outer membrane receptor protein involved in Fe transport